MIRSACMRSVCLAVAVSFVCLVSGAGPAHSDDLQLKRTFGKRGHGESHVQMRSMLAPIRRSENSRSTVNIPVTPVLTVISKDKVGHVCKLGPRISDALLQAWYTKPMLVSYIFDPDKSGEKAYRGDKSEADKAEDERLIQAINTALGEELITDILITKGSLQMGGGAISKLPFASVLGCAELEKSAPKEEPKKTH